MSSSAHTCVLTLSCNDRPGIVHAVTGVLLKHECNITKSSQHEDREAGRFYMRIRLDVPSGFSEEAFKSDFKVVADTFEMDWNFYDQTVRPRVLLMVSKFDHCLHDLLYRQAIGELQMDVPLIVSNHPDCEPLARHFGIEYKYLPVNKANKLEQEAVLLELVEELKIDLVVLARYMQILSDEACKKLEGRAINIHHSFLPSFKGAKPYHQAHARGVKLIGATAHFVTADLDEGPIIEQDIHRIDHSFSAAQCVEIGRDVERLVLARGVHWFIERKILLSGNRTIVFP